MYEELAYHRTALGELILRRRTVPGLGDQEIYEVKLNDDLLMSSLLTESERALPRLSLAAAKADEFDVLVGGLGLGYTAQAALEDDRVRSVTVIELLPEIIGWHEAGLGPLGDSLVMEPRTHLVQGDFFQILRSPTDDRRYGAILVDIDHAPDSWLHPDHEGFYGEAGLRSSRTLLQPEGVFGFWSSGRHDADFVTALSSVFDRVEPHEIAVTNPLVGEIQVDTIYVSR